MDHIDVLCVGEAMAQLTPLDGRPVEAAETFQLTAAGAESNVAIGLAQLGYRATWLGRVGDDGLGRRVVQEIAAEGVDVSQVEIDLVAPTGLFVKSPTADGSAVTY